MAIDVAKELTASQRMGVAAARSMHRCSASPHDGQPHSHQCGGSPGIKDAPRATCSSGPIDSALQHRTRAGRYSLSHRMELCSLLHYYANSPARYAVSGRSVASKTTTLHDERDVVKCLYCRCFLAFLIGFRHPSHGRSHRVQILYRPLCLKPSLPKQFLLTAGVLPGATQTKPTVESFLSWRRETHK